MKRAILENKLRNLAVMAASVFALVACGGGGGGGDHGGGLGSGTFTRTFSPASNGGNQVPFGIGTFGDVTSQGLYTPAEVGASGRITMLRFQNMLANTGPITCPNTTIRLGHSNLAALTATFASNLNVGSPVVVLSNATVNVPATATTWFDIPLTTPFDYNGVDNLVVQVDRTTVCQGTAAIFGVNSTTSSAGRRAFSGATDTTAGTAQNDTTTGVVDSVLPWMRFVFTGGDNKLEFGGTNIAANSNSFPWSANKRTQHLYLASEINGSGPITGIAFQANFQNTVAATYTYTIRLGHTTLTQLGTSFAGNFAGSPTTVANAVTGFTIPAGILPGEWFWVPIPDGIFTYNGTDNLIVEVSVPAGTTFNYVRMFPGVAGRRLFNNSDAAAATGTVDDNHYHIALRFNGASMNVIEPNLIGYQVPFSPTVALTFAQFLYGNHAMGTGGAINRVGFRLNADNASPVVFTGAAITLGHTTLADLTTTPGSNIDNPIQVFSGNITIPGGLKAGDWVDIPVSGFAYDPKKNLIVQVLAGTGPSDVILTYGGSGVVSNSGRSAPGDPTVVLEGSRHPHIRLGLSK